MKIVVMMVVQNDGEYFSVRDTNREIKEWYVEIEHMPMCLNQYKAWVEQLWRKRETEQEHIQGRTLSSTGLETETNSERNQPRLNQINYKLNPLTIKDNLWHKKIIYFIIYSFDLTIQ